MMDLDFQTVSQACRSGGPSVLTVVTELAAAAGEHGAVAPARYVRGSQATYAFETRYIDKDGSGPQAMATVVIDSKGSTLNRIEAQLSAAITDAHPVLVRTPRIRVTYEGLAPVTDLDLPHRAFDGHVRAGTVAGGGKVTADARYRAARDSSAVDARPLLELSPISVVLGSWDSTRRSHQVRFRSALVGEIVGVLADQSAEGRDVAPRGGARSDAIAPSVRLSGDQMEQLLTAQEAELSIKNAEKIRNDIRKAKKGTTSAAGLGLGSIPPSLEGLGLVACQRIIRSHVLSFSALRQLRFGLGPDGDAAARALLAALALNGLARSYEELLLRANCDLVEKEEPRFVIDGRYGRTTELAPLRIDAADDLLEEAISAAVAAGVRWDGQVFEVTGNPLIARGIISDEDGGE